jgi:hypothetical protein
MNTTPKSMLSSLSATSIFRKTKKNSWEFLGKRDLQRRSREIREMEIENNLENILSVPVKSVKIKFLNKSKTYKFPNGRLISSGFEQVKIAAKTMGYGEICLGGLKIAII